MIKGFRFTNQLANAEIDARIHQEFLNKNDGIFYGMDINNTNNSITISEGLCEIAGRPVAVIGDETIQTSNEELYCVLVLEIDLSKESTSSVFEQVSFKVLTSSISYPTVTKQDINIYNGDNNIYQLEFARFRTSTAGIKEFKDTRTFLNFKGIYDQIKKECEKIISEIKKELENVENGSRYFLKAQELINQDLNDYTEEGVYYAQGGNNVLNKPSGIDYFGMCVYRTAGSLCSQQLISNQKIFYRNFRGGENWSDWKGVSLEGHTHDIKISGAIKGNANFDGSGNITIDTSQNNVFVLTGSFALKASSNPGTFQLNTKNISYPNGLNKDNCIVLSFLGKHNTTKGWSAYQDALQDSSSMLSATTGRSIVLNDNNITIRAYNNQSNEIVLYYKIVLMKIS